MQRWHVNSLGTVLSETIATVSLSAPSSVISYHRTEIRVDSGTMTALPRTAASSFTNDRTAGTVKVLYLMRPSRRSHLVQICDNYLMSRTMLMCEFRLVDPMSEPYMQCQPDTPEPTENSNHLGYKPSPRLREMKWRQESSIDWLWNASVKTRCRQMIDITCLSLSNSNCESIPKYPSSGSMVSSTVPRLRTEKDDRREDTSPSFFRHRCRQSTTAINSVRAWHMQNLLPLCRYVTYLAYLLHCPCAALFHITIILLFFLLLPCFSFCSTISLKSSRHNTGPSQSHFHFWTVTRNCSFTWVDIRPIKSWGMWCQEGESGREKTASDHTISGLDQSIKSRTLRMGSPMCDHAKARVEMFYQVN